MGSNRRYPLNRTIPFSLTALARELSPNIGVCIGTAAVVLMSGEI